MTLPTATPTPTATPSLPPANPITVVPHGDAGRAVSQLVSADGGTISATGADGTVYTVTFARNSLLSDERITLTPLSSRLNSPRLVPKSFHHQRCYAGYRVD